MKLSLQRCRIKGKDLIAKLVVLNEMERFNQRSTCLVRENLSAQSLQRMSKSIEEAVRPLPKTTTSTKLLGKLLQNHTKLMFRAATH